MIPARSVVALSSAVLAAGLALAPAPANAEPLTCQGRPVTTEGATGTAGDDVMVVGLTTVGPASGGPGNDLICVRVTSGGEPFSYSVDAGPGDDVVLNESTDGNTRVTVLLGAGADTYTGSDVTGETVVTGAVLWPRLGDDSDVERDVVDTRGGADVVHSGSVAAGAANQDQVSLGEGDDALHWAGVQTGPAVDLGAGANRLALYRGWQGTDLLVDAPGGTATVDGRPVLRWSGAVAAYDLAVDNLRTRFAGTDADERVTLTRGTPAPAGGVVPNPSPELRRDLDLRGGDDTLVLHDMAGGDLVGGAGRDTVEMGYCPLAVVRLGAGYTCQVSLNPAIVFSGSVDAWEDVTLAGSDVRVIGTDGPDEIDARGYRVRVNGRGGDDVLTANRRNAATEERWPVVIRGGAGDDLVSGTFSPDRLVGGAGRDRIAGSLRSDLMLGGPGRDRLSGSKGSDRLAGGAGRDKADGGAGRDTCSAELRRSCER